MQIRSPLLRIIVVLLSLAVQGAWAQDGLPGAASESARAAGLRSSFSSGLVAADFDNDHKLDGALLLDAGVIAGQRVFRIELHVSASQNRSLRFASYDSSLAISALDVNRDGMPDLVVEQAFTHKRLGVWLNDGHGRFRAARVEDFPPLTDLPCKWQALEVLRAISVAGLPSRFQSDQAIVLLEMIGFDSSSSRGKAGCVASFPSRVLSSPHCPRAPPHALSL